MRTHHDDAHHHHPPHAHVSRPPSGGASNSRNPAGGRNRTTPHYRVEAWAAAFEGLPPGISPYAIVDLLQRAGRAFGWTDRLTRHLRLLISYTRPQDWEPGARPVVWLTVRETADKLGLSECQVRRNENSLMCLGALAFKDSGNHRRFGHRDGDGNIADAYGLDLSPAAALLPELTALAETTARERAEWYRLKHALSAARRRVRAALIGAMRDRRIGDRAADMLFTELAGLGARVRATAPLDELRRRLALLEDLDARLGALATGAGDAGSGCNGPDTADCRPGDADPPTAREAAASFFNDSPVPGDPEHSAEAPGTASPGPASASLEEPLRQSGTSPNMHATASKNACPGKHPCVPPLYYNTKDSLIENIPVARGGRKGEVGSGALEPAGAVLGRMAQTPNAIPPSTAAADEAREPPPVKVSFDALLSLMPARMRAWLPPGKHVSWPALVDAAAAHVAELGISQHAWGEACRVLGRQAATMAVIVIAAKHERHLIATPGGYLRAMTGRAATGELYLARSIYGLLNADDRKDTRND